MFSYKGIKPLIFDEFPYKKYMVKCAQPPQLKYLCFDHMEFRIYKGEGTAQLVAYYPFAFSVEKPTVLNNTYIAINNTGDLPANIEILYDLNNISSDLSVELRGENDVKVIGQLNFSNIIANPEDSYILINSETQLIEGLDSAKEKTGHLYNRYLDSGDFFWPPVGRSYLHSSVKFDRVSYIPMYY